MPELRFNVLTQEWVIMATERAKRPMEFAQSIPIYDLPKYEPKCPFCPGNEWATSEELYRLDGPNGWETRVVKNKYPALDEHAQPTVSGDFLQTSINGFGLHEVIIDTPRHDRTITMLSLPEVEKVVLTYRERYRAVAKDPRVKHIILFKNNGISAGSSIIHPHSQLIATPIVSNQIDGRTRVTRTYYEEHHRCIMCDMLARELEQEQRIVYENAHFACFLPYAALSSFHTWIFPKRHAPVFGDVTDDEIPALAEVLSYVLRAHEKLLGRPDYNFVFRSAPVGCDHNLYHWYISIVPRLSKTAGFEIGSNIYINPSLPELNAMELRNVVDILRGHV